MSVLLGNLILELGCESIARDAEKRGRPGCWWSSGTPARLVRPPSPPAAVARGARRTRRRLPGLALGNHAAADDREGGRAVFRKVSGALERRPGARRRLA